MPGGEAFSLIDAIAAGQLLSGVKCRMVMAHRNAEAENRLDAAAQKLRASRYDVDVVLEAGNPEDVISAIVERDHVGLLVMGAFGHSRLRSMIIGSTTTTMVRTCKIPILLYR